MALYFNLTQLSEKTMILHPVEESIFETLTHILLSPDKIFSLKNDYCIPVWLKYLPEI